MVQRTKSRRRQLHGPTKLTIGPLALGATRPVIAPPASRNLRNLRFYFCSTVRQSQTPCRMLSRIRGRCLTSY